MIIRRFSSRALPFRRSTPSSICSDSPQFRPIFPQICLARRRAFATEAEPAAAEEMEANEEEDTDPVSADPGDPEIKRLHDLRKHTRKLTGHYGSTQKSIYRPHESLLQPPHPSEITLELLLASQAHLGHATSIWNPANSQYIFGVRDGIHIISLEQTAAHLRRACRVIEEVAYRAGIILFVGSRPGHERIVVNAAKRCNGYHLFDWWIPGSLTNSQQIMGARQFKVVNELDEEVEGYEARLEERRAIKPDLVVCLNPLDYGVMLKECGEVNIPTIGILDTNGDPTTLTYPVPANDDSLRCAQLIGGTLGKAAEIGKSKRLELASLGIITFNPTMDLEPPKEDQAL
ncbi:MAG: 37S ribosomal protein, mitochondrial [Vezdaea aestivalis]|nr:MAG: 37S ribosomal protein, mitochondrial [Vezdaea aestivalis]